MAYSVGDVMSRYVEFLDADRLVTEAAEMMGDLDVGALPLGRADDLVGVLTDRDILYRAVAPGRDLSTLRAREIMSRPVVSCVAEDSVQEALQLMASHHIRRMPVMDDKRVVVGWVTLADLSRKLLVENGALQATLAEATETV